MLGGGEESVSLSNGFSVTLDKDFLDCAVMAVRDLSAQSKKANAVIFDPCVRSFSADISVINREQVSDTASVEKVLDPIFNRHLFIVRRKKKRDGFIKCWA